MGTSTKRPPPVGGQWTAAVRAYRSWQKSGAVGGAAQPAAALLDALRVQVSQKQGSHELREAMRASGARLVDTLDRLTREGQPAYVAAVHGNVEARRFAFIRYIADQVAGNGGRFADAAVRRAAVQAAEQLLSDKSLREAVDAGIGSALPVPRELFCAVYRMFFGHTLEQFLTTVIAESTDTFVQAHVPVLPIIDPEGQISDWFTQNVVSVLPTPCKDASASGPTLSALGRDMVNETVDRALGLPAQTGTS